MKANVSACVLTALLLSGNSVRAQDSDQETKKKIMQALEKGVDTLLKLKQSSKRVFEDLSKAVAEKLKRRDRPKPPMPVPPKPPLPLEEPAIVEPQFVYDHWAAWSSFNKGAWVEQETTSQFADMPESKSTTKTTVTSKDGRVVKGDRNMGGFDMKDQEIAKKLEGGGGGAPRDRCLMPGCDRKLAEHKKPETKNSTDEVDVAGKRLKCDAVEVTTYDCKGERQMTSKTWYSKEIPGWMAKSDVEMFGQFKGTSRTVVTAFGTR